jgi:hypothetical protein
MGCFESLVKSHFLANVSIELSLARKTLKNINLTQLPTSKKERRELYDEYVFQYYLLEEMEDTLKEIEDVDEVYYMQLDHIVYIYTLSYTQFKDMLQYSFDMNGDIPIFKTKHRIKGHTMYAALFDTRINFTPFSVN